MTQNTKEQVEELVSCYDEYFAAQEPAQLFKDAWERGWHMLGIEKPSPANGFKLVVPTADPGVRGGIYYENGKLKVSNG